MMSLNTCTLLFLSIPSTTLAFSALLPRQQHRRRTVIVFTTEKDLTFNPAEGYRSVNLPRANYCAEHFGVCSLEEIEDLRDNLHKERLQNFVVGGGDQQHTTKEAMEHLVLEEELELQLNLLRDEIESSSTSTTNEAELFPQVEEPMTELPHFKDKQVKESHTLEEDAAEVIHAVEDVLHHMEHSVALQEPALMEESNLETLAMCAVILALALVPEILHHMN